MSIKVNLDSYRAVARAIAAGRMVFCVETHEGWQMDGGCSLNYAQAGRRYCTPLARGH